MISNLIRYSLNIFLFFLSGCTTHISQLPSPVSELKLENEQQSVRPLSSIPSITVVPQYPTQIDRLHKIEQPNPKIHYYDWNGAMQLMVDKMLQELDVNPDSTLLVDNIVNRTNISMNVDEATKILYNILENKNKFTLVSKQQTFLAKQQLGISPRDSLEIRSKAAGIARITGAQYVLYSSVTSNSSVRGVNIPAFKIQLTLVQTQTGEIIWSDQYEVQG